MYSIHLIIRLLLNSILLHLLEIINTFYTGRPGWGIAWYVNGTIVPELVVVRNKTYTFLVSGGSNPSDASNYHPFYITYSENGRRLLNNQ